VKKQGRAEIAVATACGKNKKKRLSKYTQQKINKSLRGTKRNSLRPKVQKFKSLARTRWVDKKRFV